MKQSLGKVKELYGCGSFPAPLQDLAAPPISQPPSPQEHPQRVCLVEIGLHRENQAQVSSYRAHLTASGGCEDPCGGALASVRGTQSRCPPLPAAGRANWEHPSSRVAKCKVFLLAALPTV